MIVIIVFVFEILDGYYDKRYDWYDIYVYVFIMMKFGMIFILE